MEEQCTTLSNFPPTMAPEDHWCTISRYDTIHSIQDTAISLLPSLLVHVPSVSTPTSPEIIISSSVESNHFFGVVKLHDTTTST